jgi:hypothetical protein
MASRSELNTSGPLKIHFTQKLNINNHLQGRRLNKYITPTVYYISTMMVVIASSRSNSSSSSSGGGNRSSSSSSSSSSSNNLFSDFAHCC